MTDANVKTCPVCGCRFSKDTHESHRRWAERINCSVACSNATRLGMTQARPKVDPNIKRRFRRRARPWSEAEVAILIGRFKSGFSIPAIAGCLPGRNRDNVRQKAEQMRLTRGEPQDGPPRAPAAWGLPHARILELRGRGLSAVHIVPALAHDFPGLKYSDVQAVLDRRM